MLKEEELQGLEKALRAATPAPWYDAGAYTAGWIRRGDGANIFELASGTDADLEAVVKLRNAAPSLISELRSARKALAEERSRTLYEAAEVASTECGVCDDKHLPDGPCLIAVKILALASGNAAQPPPDSSAALREARRLLGRLVEVDGLFKEQDKLSPMPLIEWERRHDDLDEVACAARAFLGEQSEPERRDK